MRRIVMLLACFLTLFPLSARQFGFGLAKDGEKTEDHAYGGFSASVAYEPLELTTCNPSLTFHVAVESDEDWGISVPSLGLVLNVDLFRTLHHPFGILAHNRIAWDPAVSVGGQLRLDGDETRPALYLSVSPLKFSVPDFWYEALSPFWTYSSEGWSWGLTVFRCTWMFK